MALKTRVWSAGKLLVLAGALSLTYTFEAQSREQLDALYRELTSCEKVLIVL